MANENLANLQNEVSEATTVQASAVALINGLAGKITQIKEELAQQGIDNATLNQLSTDLDASSNELAAAVAANTVAEDEEPPVE